MSFTTRQPEVAVFPGTQKHIGFLAGCLILLICCPAPRAAATTIYTLAPGANVTALSSSYPIGGLMVGSESTNFSTGTLNGTFTSTVYSGDMSNPYGGLTFTYLLELNGSSSDASSEFSVGGYAGFLTDVSYNQTGGEVAPSNFLRSGNGNVIHSQWFTSVELPSGDTGALLVIQTDAHNFGNNSGSVIDSTSQILPILAPVPEPGALSLLAIGFGALFIFRRRSSN